MPAVVEVWEWLAAVPDPEIPVVSVVDLGIVRDVAYVAHADGTERLHVAITPTYSGCPATMTIERLIRETLAEHGVHAFALDTRLAPAWTTDWLTAEAREKLRAYGIAPPEENAAALGVSILRRAEARVTCPRCAATDVAMTSRFGSTPCKALYVCNACREPFDHFKCH
jgi:ring-1,2-phenylacetyl-CoA epoxidase subunit PaaD